MNTLGWTWDDLAVVVDDGDENDGDDDDDGDNDVI